MYNDYMYAVQRDDEYLAHYGIKGMKWGVRKAVESGNSRALGRAYRKASRKLARLEKRANNGKKYARRAALLGAGAAAAGGLAAAGTQGVAGAMRWAAPHATKATAYAGKGMRKAGTLVNAVGNATGNIGLRRAGLSMVGRGNAIERTASGVGKSTKGAAAAISRWGGKNTISDSVARKTEQLVTRRGIKGNNIAVQTAKGMKANAAIPRLSNNTIARAGAAAVGAGLAGAAGYNAYRAATTKRAARKAQEWRNEMNKAFAGTQYANGGGRKRRRRR